VGCGFPTPCSQRAAMPAVRAFFGFFSGFRRVGCDFGLIPHGWVAPAKNALFAGKMTAVAVLQHNRRHELKKKNPIVKVSFQYRGTEAQFRTFLESLVRSYVAVSYSDTNAKEESVASVEKEHQSK